MRPRSTDPLWIGRTHERRDALRPLNEAELFAQRLVLGQRPPLEESRRILPRPIRSLVAARFILVVSCAAVAAGGVAWIRSWLRRR